MADAFDTDDLQLEKMLKAMSGKSLSQEKKRVAASKKQWKRKIDAVYQKAIKDVDAARALHAKKFNVAQQRLLSDIDRVRAAALQLRNDFETQLLLIAVTCGLWASGTPKHPRG